ncbi:hypothetical protein SAMN06273570_2871 [Candidatus Pantoea floridensis]|uniref:Uncharacterized protein n=1 Tax=Candidatus Pantoea floridensis TaxID=1938870 RepID=A0A286BWD5_9GAMM|nr:hypothetical protein BX596_0313 [Enterobacteriaceae bacterium JKS000233]SOD38455.1 hypothetical protein SAMN06273570_2871 [Pantoea floridensis]
MRLACDTGFVRYPLWARRPMALVAVTVSALNLRSDMTSDSSLLREVGPDLGFGVNVFGI